MKVCRISPPDYKLRNNGEARMGLAINLVPTHTGFSLKSVN